MDSFHPRRLAHADVDRHHGIRRRPQPLGECCKHHVEPSRADGAPATGTVAPVARTATEPSPTRCRGRRARAKTTTVTATGTPTCTTIYTLHNTTPTSSASCARCYDVHDCPGLHTKCSSHFREP